MAGAAGVSTDAQGAWWGGRGEGTLPHSLIASYLGDTVAATRALARRLPDSVRIVSLVDFDNDCVGTALAVARALGEKLFAVRLDTAEDMVDQSLAGDGGGGEHDPCLRGVNPPLVRNVRDALDRHGFSHVRIVTSGGFDADRIRRFREAGVPVDAFGVGLVADSGPGQLHRGCRARGWPAGRQGRPGVPVQPLAGASGVTRRSHGDRR